MGNYYKDLSPLSKLEKLEDLIVDSNNNIYYISFLEKNKGIKKLNLYNCRTIKDFTPINKVEKLEELNLSYTNISDISFWESNKNIKKLNLYNLSGWSGLKK